MAAGGDDSRMKADINVTPLVDIVLVLLIIFIVITPAVNNAVRLPIAKHSVKPEAGKGARPLSLMIPALRDPGTNQVTGPAPVVVDDVEAKDASGNLPAFRLDEAEGRRRLQAYIGSHLQDSGDKRVFVKADADLPFHYVNDLFQLCREAGASEAAIVTSEDRRPEGGE